MKNFLALLFSLLFLLLLFYFIPLEDILKTLKGTGLYNLFFAFFLYTVSQGFRSLRWKLLIRDVSFFHLFLINSANIMFNNLLPARTGEVSWFYYLRRIKVNLSLSFWTFFLGRFYDLLSLLFLFFLSLSTLKIAMLLPSFLLIMLGLFLPRFHSLIPNRGRLGDVKNFIKRETSLSLAIALILLSSLSHTVKFASLIVLLDLRNLDLYKTFLAFLGGELSSILPIHSFMGFGSYELAFAFPLKLLGESLKEWIKLGFLFHNFLLISSILMGLPSAMILLKVNKKD